MAETGHAKNVANFGVLVSYVEGYGASYAPSNAAILLTALQDKMSDAEDSLDGVFATLAPWKNAVNARETAYSGLRKLVTRVVNSFAASGADQNAIDDAKAIKRKIDGARAKALPKDDPETPEDESKGHSVSQRSYSQTAEFFDELIAFLGTNSEFYNPNETALQLTTLTTRSNELKAANEDVNDAAVPLSNARIARDVQLYTEKAGLVDLAGLVKKYVKSIYGADSLQFKQISKLVFRKLKKITAELPPVSDD